MNIRRLVIGATLMAVALAPSFGHAIADKNRPITGTNCTVGDETLTYSKTPGSVGWFAQGSINCGDSAYESIQAQLGLIQIQGANTTQAGLFTGSPAITVSDYCKTNPCAAFTIGNLLPKKTLAQPALYILRVTGQVVDSGDVYTTTHATCYLVKDGAATELLEGCQL